MVTTRIQAAVGYLMSGGTGVAGAATLTTEQTILMDSSNAIGVSLPEVALVIGIIGTIATIIFQYLNYRNMKKFRKHESNKKDL